MKYYVIEISTGDAKIAGKGVYEYETKNEAVASFHKKVGTAMSSNLYTSDLVMVIDSFGSRHAHEYYEAETAEE